MGLDHFKCLLDFVDKRMQLLVVAVGVLQFSLDSNQTSNHELILYVNVLKGVVFADA